MRANARPDWQITELVQDVLWSHHIYRRHASLSDNVYDSMCVALAQLAEVDPVRAAAVFASLCAEPFESAAFLLVLVRGYAGNPTSFADDAAEWLVATPRRAVPRLLPTLRRGSPASCRRHLAAMLARPFRSARRRAPVLRAPLRANPSRPACPRSH